MPTLADAVEGSTYVIQISLYKEDASPVVPNAALWSMRDNYARVVNSRQDVPLVPATAMTIVLSGDDLAYEPNSKSMRSVTVTGTYDGDYGTDLPVAEEFSFSIRPLTGIPDA